MNDAAQCVAIWAAGLFSGAAVYVSLVEHPARMQCGTLLAVTQFAPSYKRGAVMQASLALVGSVAGAGSATPGTPGCSARCCCSPSSPSPSS